MSKELEKFNISKSKKISDKSISKIVDKILNTTLTRDFIDKYNLSNKEIVDNFLPLLICAENQDCCRNCKGVEECKLEGVKGYYNVPIIDFYGTIDTEFKACQYQEERNLYVYRDFDDDKLKWFLKPEDMFSDVRKSIGQLLGEFLNNKINNGVYLYGVSGIGKTYLAICLANKIIKVKKKTVAYVNVKKFVSDMTKIVFEDKVLFNEKLEVLKNVDYLFLDGLGNEKITKFSRDEILTPLFDFRKEKNLLKNVILSNNSLDELKILYNIDNKISTNKFVNLIKSMVIEEEMTGIDFNSK